jgi:hypothetical protein
LIALLSLFVAIALFSLLSWQLNLLFPEGVFLLAGAFFGFVLNLVAQSLSRATLKIEILDDASNSRTATYKFLHVRVANVEPPAYLRWLFGSQVSTFTKAKIKFLEPTTSTSLFEVDGRWSSTGEPMQNMVVTDPSGQISHVRLFDYSKVPSLRTEYILPGESVNLAIAVKFQGDSGFFGFSNESYAFDLQNPDWKLHSVAVPIEITVAAGNGERITRRFTIVNPNSNYDHFRIEE